MTATGLDPALPMSELLLAYPGAQRALFRKYHVGGCSSCGFAPTESLAQICQRNPHMDVSEICAFLETSREEDEAMEITPEALNTALQGAKPESVRLLDIRTREEFESVHIAGSALFSQALMQTILLEWSREEGLIVLIDHQGTRSLDAAAYFAGHGFTNVRALRGGIDAWSETIEATLPRYRLE